MKMILIAGALALGLTGISVEPASAGSCACKPVVKKYKKHAKKAVKRPAVQLAGGPPPPVRVAPSPRPAAPLPPPERVVDVGPPVYIDSPPVYVKGPPVYVREPQVIVVEQAPIRIPAPPPIYVRERAYEFRHDDGAYSYKDYDYYGDYPQYEERSSSDYSSYSSSEYDRYSSGYRSEGLVIDSHGWSGGVGGYAEGGSYSGGGYYQYGGINGSSGYRQSTASARAYSSSSVGVYYGGRGHSRGHGCGSCGKR